MNDWKLPWEGGCRCDAVRFRVTQPPLITVACHCTGCQRMSSSAFSLTVIVPAKGFDITKGEPVIGGRRGAEWKHMFCAHCMTWMYTLPTQMPDIVNVRSTMLDAHDWCRPYAETFTKERLPWASAGAVKSFDGFPAPGELQGLMEEFAKAGIKP